ncbi:MAG: RagB/SusD family nutrient uptake outer membrane protein [Cyclobacteriaceae bacterium]|nr:RagB/SusD family nutrient uptake outer membrane protein [Cyclobacteriaceae bacterium]
MKNIIKLFTLTGLIFLASGCNDAFLDRFPETSIGKENFFKSEEDLAMYVYNLYNFPGFEQYVGDAATDNATTTGSTELKTMMVSSPSSATINGGWNWENLRTINFFLDNFGNADISETLLNHYEGLGRFFRAQFYIAKVKRYSDVPWYETVIETDDEEAMYKARDPRDFVVGKIMADLEFAAANVMADGRSGAVNTWVVKAYLARYALYEGTFRKYHAELGLEGTANDFLNTAANTAKDIMDNGGFALQNTGNPDADYASLFNSTNLEGNSEVILATFSETDQLNSGWWSYMFGNYEVSPSKDLLQSYLQTDGSPYTNQAGYQTRLFTEEFVDRDPRLSQTYAYPGFELIHTSTYSQGGGTYIQQLAKSFSGYHQLKGFVNSTDQSVFNSLDFPVLRFAETLLIYAEAKAELAQLTQGDLDMTINQLRDRAGMPALTMGPVVDPVQEGRYPNIKSGTSQWAELLEIRRERRVELALEGYRTDDLMRWYAGKLIEQEPEGIYFPDLGKYDLTGDGIEDIILIDYTASIPLPEDKALNALGVPLVYYRAGTFGQDASIFLKNGNSGTLQTVEERGAFEEPKYYYRPIPQTHVTVNPNLNQIFGWD